MIEKKNAVWKISQCAQRGVLNTQNIYTKCGYQLQNNDLGKLRVLRVFIWMGDRISAFELFPTSEPY